MKITLLFIVMLLFPLMGLAQENNSKSKHFGLATSIEQSPFVGGKTQLGISVASLDNSGFNIAGPALPLFATPSRRFYLGLGLDEWDHERGESERLNNMHPLKRAVNVRVGGAWKIANGAATVDIAKAVNTHQGLQTKIRYTYDPAPHNNTFNPYAELQWLSADLTDYYVGVNQDESQIDRPAYQAKAENALKAGVKFQRPLRQRLHLVGSIDVNHYGKEISNSPIIEKNTVWSGTVGVTYQWR